ncbi:porin [Cupriavidus consociatus]|uniref:porin n=1 Tax=Cupriavidus consociatus TaxID=2821357 RepID=UPI001AE9D158|nr:MULTISPECIES: porin [unclassified Cupriavidus]MBP0624858.1 porin [Cupriavidus sp. LEh25]MDK2661585.1 porin [Cupriavidus sp. LEh21]
MKLKVLAMSAALLAGSGAYAQSSVTLYGVADVGIEYLNHAVASTGTVPAGAQSHNLWAMQSGNQSGSRWGLRGVEDLGGGLSGIFLFESGFNLDTGTSGQGGRLFGRGAYVGLKNQWGQLTLGRHTTPFFDFGVYYDPMAIAARYSSGAQDPYMGGARADNSAKYMGKFGGLSVTALYSLNSNNQEVAGNFTNGRSYSLALSYDGGPFSVGAIYDQSNRSAPTALSTDSLIRRAAVAGTYTLGPAKLYAGYRYAHAFNGATLPGVAVTNTVSNLGWFGVGYQVLPALSVTGSAYYQNLREGNAGNPWLFVALVDYTLSKRTDIYTSVAYSLNRGKSNLGVVGFNDQLGASSEAVRPGANQFGAIVGIRHKF